MPIELTEREQAIAKGEDPEVLVDAETPETTTDGDGCKDASSDTTDAGDAGDAGAKPVQDVAAGQGGLGGTDAATSWIDDATKEAAKGYGLSEADLAGMASAEEYERATRLLDQRLFAAGGGEAKTTADPAKPAETPKAPDAKPKDDAAKDGPSKDGKPEEIDPQWYIDNGYDEETVKLVKAHKSLQERHAQTEERLAKIEEFHRNQTAQDAIDLFHDFVDGMDAERYGRSMDDDGKPKKLAKEADAARQKLYETAATLAAGITARAKSRNEQAEMPPLQELLRRAERLAFAEELAKKDRKAFHQQVAAQAKRRRPVPGRSQPRGEPAETSKDPVRAIAEHPDIVKLWNEFEEANGA